GGAAARCHLCRRADRQPGVQGGQAGLCRSRGGEDGLMAETPTNGPPTPGAFYARDRSRHPPALAPGYKSSVLRAPQRALISFDNTLSEMTGPTFGHSIIGPLDHDLIVNFARPGEEAIGQRIIVHG